MRSLFSAIAVLGVLASSAIGCAAGPSADDSTEDPKGESTSNLTGCAMTRAQILASASPGRKLAVQRGFEWLDANVPYSQSASHEGYRTDCSGFVSMCWSLGRSSNTSALYSGDGNNRLGSYDDLIVADALVKQGHTVLFLGWNDAAHNGVCVLEQSSTANDMQFRVRTKASLLSAGYKAIRAKTLATEIAPATPDEEVLDPIEVPEVTPKPKPKPTTPGTDVQDDVDTDGVDRSSVEPQSDDVGDPGDPDEQTEEDAADDDESSSSRSSKKRRSASSDSEIASAGCSMSSGSAGSPAGQLASWAPVLGVLLVLRRRRRSA